MKNVFNGVIRPALLAQGFTEDMLNDKKRFKLARLGESAPATGDEPARRCEEASDPDRRVVVVVQ